MLWWRVDNIDVADRGRAGGGIRDKQDLPAWGRLDANFRFCPGGNLQRVRLRRWANGAQPRHRSRPAGDRPGSCRLGWNTDPAADRIPDCRETEASAAGSSLEQSVKAQIYLADIADMPDCLDVWSRYYAGIPCAITVGPTKSFATAGGIIEINLIALTNGAIRQKEVVDANIPGMAAFGPSLKVGEFLLPSGLMAIGRDGHIAGSIVSPNFPGLAHAGYSQAEAVYGYAEALCQAAGTTMDRLLRAQYFMADIGAFPGIAMAWSSRYSDQPHPFVCVQTPQPMPAPGAALIADFWISTIS